MALHPYNLMPMIGILMTTPSKSSDVQTSLQSVAGDNFADISPVS